MEYYGEFEYNFPGLMEGATAGVAGIVTGIFLIVYFLLMGVSLVSYVLGSLGMYRVAKRRGIHHAWLAWVPVGNNWLLGSISDHYQYVVKHKVTKRRTVLLILSIILMGISILFGVATGVTVASMDAVSADMGGAILSVALMVITYLAVMGLSIAICVIGYIAYYDLFQSSRPEYSVLFLVLGIFFSIAIPFFVFACSKYDKGMPARRVPQEPVQVPFEPELQVPAEEEIPVVEAEVVDDPE